VDAASGEISVKNKFFFTSAENFDIHWELTGDGQALAEGIIEKPDIAPQGEKTFMLDIPQVSPRPGVEYFLNFKVVSREDNGMVPKGH